MLVRETEGYERFVRDIRRWEDNIKNGSKTGFEGVNWIHLA
jgi:hypothetical protein